MLSKWKVDMVNDVAHRCAYGYGHNYELVRDTSSRMYDVFVDASLATRVNSLDDAKQWIETTYGTPSRRKVMEASHGAQDTPPIQQGAPIVPPPSNEHGDALDALDVLKKVLGGGGNIGELAAEIDGLKATIEEIKAAQKSAHAIHEIHVRAGTDPIDIPPQVAHEILPTVISFLSRGNNVWLTGPSGSGKTHMAAQVAKVMGRPFYLTGAILQKYELLGFVDANGKYVRTAFRDAVEYGGLFLWDEGDASSPSAMVAFNAILAKNGFADFPDGVIEVHPDFCCIVAANTYGKGADASYVGRNQLDAATRRRFAFLTMGYDEKLEKVLTGEDEIGKSWVREVQAWRAAIEALKLQHIVCPRASIQGADMLRNGMDKDTVEEAYVWQGLDAASVRKVKEASSC